MAIKSNHVLVVLGIGFSSPRERIEFQKKTTRAIVRSNPCAIIQFVQPGNKAEKQIKKYTKAHPGATVKQCAK